jgi:hypothetical protein
MYPERKEGLVIMTNGEKGALLIEEILRGQSSISGWKEYKVKEKAIVELSENDLQKYVGRYRLVEYPLIFVVVSNVESDLFMKVEQPGITPLNAKLYFEGNHKFFRTDVDIELQFSADRTSIQLNQSGQVFKATKSN